ncbi:MAG TPA: glycoside hydrolase [Sulfuricurvum sp.]|nr:glycoside hydrolase [Sulfuricurvum sp.]
MSFAFRHNAVCGTVCAVLFCFFSGCSAPALQPSVVEEQPCHANDPADLAVFPQRIEPYLSGIKERKTVLPQQQTYEQHFYSVWDADYRPEPLDKVKWPFEVYTPEDAYGENLRPLPQSWFYAMMREAAWNDYGSVGVRAIALKRLDLRNFPTQKPLFRNPCEAGEGFPFDYLQNSAVYANEPLYLSHYSKSRAWAYVLTSYATGWVPSDSIARVSAAQQKQWRHRPLLALLGDKKAVHTSRHDYLFGSDTGMLLPLAQERRNGYVADAAITKGVRKARIVHATIPADAAAVVPMRLERTNLQRVITPMLQTKYGWGGLFGERDCSSTMRDIFAPFGIWLPRNSYQQSQIGQIVSFEGMDDRAKLETIVREGKPFETLLYLKGHIVLYLGRYNGEPAVLHTIWGIKTVQKNGTMGRHIVGKTVISSLRFGKELEGYTPEHSLLHKLESMNFILEVPFRGGRKK